MTQNHYERYDKELNSFTVSPSFQCAKNYLLFVLSDASEFTHDAPIEEYLTPPSDELRQTDSRDAMLEHWAYAYERFETELKYDSVLLSDIIEDVTGTPQGRELARKHKLNSLPKLLELIGKDEDIFDDLAFFCG